MTDEVAAVKFVDERLQATSGKLVRIEAYPTDSVEISVAVGLARLVLAPSTARVLVDALSGVPVAVRVEGHDVYRMEWAELRVSPSERDQVVMRLTEVESEPDEHLEPHGVDRGALVAALERCVEVVQGHAGRAVCKPFGVGYQLPAAQGSAVMMWACGEDEPPGIVVKVRSHRFAFGLDAARELRTLVRQEPRRPIVVRGVDVVSRRAATLRVSASGDDQAALQLEGTVGSRHEDAHPVEDVRWDHLRTAVETCVDHLEHHTAVRAATPA